MHGQSVDDHLLIASFRAPISSDRGPFLFCGDGRFIGVRELRASGLAFDVVAYNHKTQGDLSNEQLPSPSSEAVRSLVEFSHSGFGSCQMTKRCVFVSDLHHFSRRAEQRRYEEAVRRSMEDADVMVLGGDIFDFKWSTIETHDETIEAAGNWIRDLVDTNPNCQVSYVLGNHDFDPDLMGQLDKISEDTKNFDWHPYHIQYGESLFLHGDVADRTTNHEQLM